MKVQRLQPLWVFVVLLFLGGPAFSQNFVRSDSNADGAVDLSDAIFTLQFLFLGGSTPSCLDSADANDDETIDLSDPVLTLNWLFLAGPAPPAPTPSVGFGAYPFADCGPDPAGVALDCLLFGPC